MKVLFVSSGNKGTISPITKNQGESLMSAGVEIDYFLIQGKGFNGYLKNIKPLQLYLHKHKYDVIHAHYSLSAFVASLAGAKPLVVSLMGSDVKAAKWYKFIIRLFASVFSWKAIIVKSNDMYNDLGMERAIVIPNGVNMERFKPMDKACCQERLGWNRSKKHILFPANTSRPEKDFALAEAAVKELEDERVRKFEIELHAFENTPNEETPYWYNAADVVLMTSKWEGSPNAIKEAMACSRPIVATDVGDIAERTKGIDGCYIVKSREPRDIVEALEKAITFEGKTKGRERIISDGLSSNQVAECIIRIYEKVVNHK